MFLFLVGIVLLFCEKYFFGIVLCLIGGFFIYCTLEEQANGPKREKEYLKTIDWIELIEVCQDSWHRETYYCIFHFKDGHQEYREIFNSDFYKFKPYVKNNKKKGE